MKFLTHMQYNIAVVAIASSLGHTAVVHVLLKVPGVDVNLQEDTVRL